MPEWLTLDDVHALRPDKARTTIWRWVQRWRAKGPVRVADRVRDGVGGRELLIDRATLVEHWALDEVA